MEIFYGTSAGPGVAIAAAARLGEEYGVPALSPERLRRIGERLRGFGMEQAEPEQIVLVADRFPPGFWLGAMPGAEIVGLAAQSPAALSPAPTLPAVVGLGDTLLHLVAEDDILIIDGDRGRVYLSPDAGTVARYQSPHRLSRRFFLEGDHLPARTASDSRIVSVVCAARTLAEAEAAMAAGADGLVVTEDNDFLGGETLAQTGGEQAQMIGDLARIVGGQPLLLDIPQERLSLAALARGAAVLPLSLIVRDAADRAELRERLDAIEEVLDADDVLYGRVRLELGFAANAGSDVDLPDTLDGFDGTTLLGRFADASWERLLPAASQARHAVRPLTVFLEGSGWPQFLGDALGIGAGRLVVSVDAVADIKDAVREL